MDDSFHHGTHDDTCSSLLTKLSTMVDANGTPCLTMDPHDHSSNGHGGHEHHGGCNATHGAYSVPLHVAAIFILLAASFLGTIMPLAGKYVPALRMNMFAVVLAKCVSTGVVMAVSLLTMLNHSLHSFQENCVPTALKSSTYDAYALLFAMIAAMLMHMIDILMDILLEKWATESESRGTASEVVDANGSDIKNKQRTSACNMEGCCTDPTSMCELRGCCQGTGVGTVTRLTGARRVAAAVLMEFGLTLHSVFLGISVGITDDSSTKTLLVALSFHQLFEGLALGSRLAEASMHSGVELLLTLVFSFSVPVGTAIGLITIQGSTVSVTGPVFVVLQAIVNAIGGGILLYLGFGLLLNDFPADLRRHAGLKTAHRGWKCLAMFVALWAGAAIMAVLANWH
ncbi:Zinc/iron permease [Trypanosoma melophagium]|uniref:Zinc/iron permease n=1 Tax=Trypanosoma melophagium TaxID=715481 RepID=UPI00351A9CC9|nr:Zinc/iron permease [Trypanosoma melophagium]